MRISRNHQPLRRSREGCRLFTRDYCFQFFLGVIPGHHNVIAKTEIDGQGGSRAPAILRIASKISAARVKKLLAGLSKISGSANQEVGKIQSCLLPIKTECPVHIIVVALVNLIVVSVYAELEGVGAYNFCEIIKNLERIVEF